MDVFKNWKKLYQTEYNNRKLYEKRYREVKLENEELQKKTGVAKLRKQVAELRNQVMDLKVQKAQLRIELEDTIGFLQQEKQAKEELLRQRNFKKRTYRPRVKKEANDGEKVLH